MRSIGLSAMLGMIIGLLVLPVSDIWAADTQQKSCALEHTIRLTMNYLLYLPKDYEQKPAWPLLLFLHGIGERGDDLQQVQPHGPPKLIEAGQEFLKKNKGNVLFTLYLNGERDVWTETYANPQLYEWLLQQKRTPPNPEDAKK